MMTVWLRANSPHHHLRIGNASTSSRNRAEATKLMHDGEVDRPFLRERRDLQG